MRLQVNALTAGTMTTVFCAPGSGTAHFAISGSLTGAEVVNIMVDGRSYSNAAATLNFNSSRHQVPLPAGIDFQFSHTTLANSCQLICYPNVDRNY